MAEAETNLPINRETHTSQDRQAELNGFERLWSEMERAFDTFGRRGDRHPFAPPLSFDLSLPRFERWGIVPAVDVAKLDKLYEITAELPGMAPGEVHVKLSDGILTISGEKKSKSERPDHDSYVRERRYGSFRRSFRLPDDIVTDEIQARFSDGVLNVSVPRRERALPKEEIIPVKQE